MRLSAFIGAVLLAMIFLAALARAEDLPNAPGWSLTSFSENQNSEDSDNSAAAGKVYFALKPPDSRPAITIDSRTADLLRSGEFSAETVYSGQSSASTSSGKKESEEFVYGSHGNGFAAAEPVNSTLTLEEGRKDLSPSAPSAESGPAMAMQAGAGGIPGFGRSGGGSSSGASSRPSSGSASGASRAPAAAQSPNAASGGPGGASSSASQSAAGGGQALVEDPRAVAVAQARALELPTATSTSTSTATTAGTGGGIAVTNGAQGFGMPVSTSSSSNSNFTIWPNGDPSVATGTRSTVSTVVQMNQTTRPVGPNGEYCEDMILPVQMVLRGYEDCMRQLSQKLPSAEGIAFIPDSLQPEAYCRRQFPSFNGAGYSVNERLYVKFSFLTYETCTDDILNKAPAFGAKVIIPDRQSQDPMVAANAFCREQFPLAPATPNPPPVVTDDSGSIVSGPAACGELKSSTAYFCYDSRTVDKGDPGSFNGYQNFSKSISKKDCQSWCSAYGEKGVCIYGVAKAPCGQRSCRFWPESLCQARGPSFKFLQLKTRSDPDELPKDFSGSVCD